MSKRCDNLGNYWRFITQVKKDLRHRIIRDEAKTTNTSRDSDNIPDTNTIQEQAKNRDPQSVFKWPAESLLLTDPV